MRLAVPVACLCLALRGAAEGPELAARNVVHAADHSSGRVAPGEIVLLYPTHAGPAVLSGIQLEPGGNVTTQLGGIRVLFDGVPAPVAYTYHGELEAVVPYEVANRKATEIVVEYEGLRSAPVTLAVVETAPALFTLEGTGAGQAAMLNETGCCNSTRNPARRGSIAVLYATGEGQTVPPGKTGTVSAFVRVADYPVPRLPVQVWVGGRRAEILFAAEAPHSVAGMLQVNFRVPVDAPAGDAVPITLTVGDTRSPDGVTMAIRPAVQAVLLIEPEQAARDWLRRILSGAGYDVIAARNGREAVDQAGRRAIDLVIASLALPREERMEAMRALAADRPQLRIAATATASGPATLKAADLLGAQAVLVKPLALEPTLRRVRELLKVRPVPYELDQERSAPGVPH